MGTKKFIATIFSVVCYCSLVGVASVAQSPAPAPDLKPTSHKDTAPEPKKNPPCPNPDKNSSGDKNFLEKKFLENILKDQCVIWTSPARLTAKDAKVLVPFAAATAALMTQDHRTSSFVGSRGNLPPISRAVSEGGTALATGGIAVTFYAVGRATGNKKARETGLLSAQALINTAIVTRVIKKAMSRNRPDDGDGRGRFFRDNDSFPSGHASAIWSVATVIAYEYQNKPFVKYGAFAAAAAVSLSRYSGRKHFLSDILVGGAIGFYIGRYVYRTHHADDLGTRLYKKSNTFTKLTPQITPFYDPRTRTYGGRFVWKL